MACAETQASAAPAPDSPESGSATQLADPPSAGPSPVLVVPASSEGYGQVTITSDPDAAEIYVDGKFHGNAHIVALFSSLCVPRKPDSAHPLSIAATFPLC